MLRTISTLFLDPPPPLPPGVVINTIDNVLIPLSEAHLHSHSYRSRLTSTDDTAEDTQKDDDDDDDDDLEGGGGRDEGTGMLLRRSSSSGELLGMTAAEREYTIGSLRREVRAGGGKRTAAGRGEYESE